MKILVAHALGIPEHVDRIKAVNPAGLEVVMAPYREVVDPYPPPGQQSTSGAEPQASARDFFAEAPNADVIVGFRLPKDILRLAPKLKWVHAIGAGVEHLLALGLLEKGVLLTNSTGVNARPIAEYVIGAFFAHAKHLEERLQAQSERRWARFYNTLLKGKTVGVIGLGHIGRDVARLAAALEMEVLAVRSAPAPGETAPNVARLYGQKDLLEVLGRSDFVAVCVSLTPQTARMFGPKEFLAMKRDAYFLNISRGQVVDERAIVQALRSGHLGGAALDVFEREPLPPESELWTTPNVLISAHNSAGIKDSQSQVIELFCENLRRFQSGQPLLNRVTSERGY